MAETAPLTPSQEAAARVDSIRARVQDMPGESYSPTITVGGVQLLLSELDRAREGWDLTAARLKEMDQALADRLVELLHTKEHNRTVMAESDRLADAHTELLGTVRRTHSERDQARREVKEWQDRAHQAEDVARKAQDAERMAREDLEHASSANHELWVTVDRLRAERDKARGAAKAAWSSLADAVTPQQPEGTRHPLAGDMIAVGNGSFVTVPENGPCGDPRCEACAVVERAVADIQRLHPQEWARRAAGGAPGGRSIRIGEPLSEPYTGPEVAQAFTIDVRTGAITVEELGPDFLKTVTDPATGEPWAVEPQTLDARQVMQLAAGTRVRLVELMGRDAATLDPAELNDAARAFISEGLEVSDSMRFMVGVAICGRLGGRFVIA